MTIVYDEDGAATQKQLVASYVLENGGAHESLSKWGSFSKLSLPTSSP